jgi:hypothetical protein
MAKLQKDILSEEERLSGFDVGEPDDDTFALGNSDYFEDIEEIFDVPKEPEQIPESEPELDYMVLKNVVDQSEKPELPIQEVPVADVPNVSSPEDDVLVMDDDFKDFVKDLLDKDKVHTVKPSLPVEETPVVDNYDPDKELSGAEKIYLDDLETDNKESETDDSGATIVAVPLMADSTKSEDAKEEAKADAEEDEKRRKLFPILLIAGIAAAILLISLSVIYFMYLSQSDEQSKIATDTIKAIQEAPTQTVEKQAEPMAEIVTDSADTVELSQPEPNPEPSVEPSLTPISSLPSPLSVPLVLTSELNSETGTGLAIIGSLISTFLSKRVIDGDSASCKIEDASPPLRCIPSAVKFPLLNPVPSPSPKFKRVSGTELIWILRYPGFL